MQWLDELGFDEAWVGEHHSAGYEIISSPELFLADLAARTRQIRLGTGVVSLPYHSPLMVAERMNQLDHLTRGRAMLGVGPGLLPSDAMMLGIDPREQRRMMGESLDVVLRLLRGEVVTEKTDWFELRDAKLHLAPYSRPHLEVAVAASVTPSGPRTAGRYGISMLSPAATTQGGFSALAYHWGIVEETAAEHGQHVARDRWRVAGWCHVAETREQARRDVMFGLADFLYYFQKVVALPGIPETGTPEECLDAMMESGVAVVGTPDDLIAQIERLEEQSGGFGAFLSISHDWANRDAERAQLRADRALRHAALPGRERVHPAQHGVGAGEPHAVPGRRHAGRDGGDPEGCGGALGEGGESVARRARRRARDGSPPRCPPAAR